jgi:hypothetical protein
MVKSQATLNRPKNDVERSISFLLSRSPQTQYAQLDRQKASSSVPQTRRSSVGGPIRSSNTGVFGV